MSSTWYHSLIVLVTCLVACCASASLGVSSGPGGVSSGFGLAPAHFQSWQEWAKKRNFATGSGSPLFSRGLFSTDKFQDWREYMNKRGFHIPDSSEGQQHFQSWVDWNKRQGLGGNSGGTPFPNPQEFGKFGSFQNWEDWYSKRGSGSPPFGQAHGLFGESRGNGMQTWNEYMKRQGFGMGSASHSLTSPNMAGLQGWHEWAKRMGPLTTSGGRWGDFGSRSFDWNNKNQLMDWQSMYKHSADKRQLGYGPHSFGRFHNYFTNGLQDWRSTFKGSKRSAESEASHGEGSSDSSEKDDEQ